MSQACAPRTGPAGIAVFSRRRNTTALLYDGVNVVQELSGSPLAPRANLLTGLGVDEILTRTDSAGTRHLLTDALGSTLGLTDSSGTLLTEYTYEPFGNTIASGQANANPFQYTGRENDGTGLYYYRARYYNPNYQRFISEDPIGLEGGINLYAYVGDDPIDFADPLGLGKKPRPRPRPGKPPRPPCPPGPPKPPTPPPQQPPTPPPPKPPQPPKPRDCQNGLSNCAREAGKVLLACVAGAQIAAGSVLAGCLLDCAFSGPGFPACAAGCLALSGAVDFALGEFCLGTAGLVFAACSAQYLSRC